MKIREDIFPEFKDYKGLQDLLQRYTNYAFKAFNGFFSSKTEVIQYIHNFQKPEDAKLFLIKQIIKFYVQFFLNNFSNLWF